MEIAFREKLDAGGVLILDGAMGTMLQASGLEEGDMPEVWNLRHPERILAVHLGYLAAGSDIIAANTFGGNRIKLERAGKADICADSNRAAVALAKQAAGGQAYVAGDIGPTGELLEPFGALSVDDAIGAYAEQAALLAEEGVDLFLIETMSDLEEARAAITAIRRVSDLPIICSMSFDMGGRTMMGATPARTAAVFSDLGIDAFGANCGLGPEEMELVVREMLEAKPQAVIIAQPNAGMPELEQGRAVYSATPETMGVYARRFAAMGVRLIGACCGSDPTYIAAMAQAVREYR
jgi:methionine synthase I (cobalamin-dependent)